MAATRGAAIAAQMELLRLTQKQIAARARLTEKTVSKALRDQPGVRPSTYQALEDALARTRAEWGGGPSVDSTGVVPSGQVRLTVSGMHGDFELTVEGALAQRDELRDLLGDVLTQLGQQQEDGDREDASA